MCPPIHCPHCCQTGVFKSKFHQAHYFKIFTDSAEPPGLCSMASLGLQDMAWANLPASLLSTCLLSCSHQPHKPACPYSGTQTGFISPPFTHLVLSAWNKILVPSLYQLAMLHNKLSLLSGLRSKYIYYLPVSVGQGSGSGFTGSSVLGSPTKLQPNTLGLSSHLKAHQGKNTLPSSLGFL